MNIHYQPGQAAKTRKIKDVSEAGAANMRFECDGRQFNVADYFAVQKQIHLKHPGGKLFTVFRFLYRFVVSAMCINTKSRQNPEWYPIELCHVVANQPYKGALGEQEVTAMIKCAAIPADESMGKSVNQYRANRGEIQAQLNQLGLDVEERAMAVPARILPQPALRYGADQAADVRDGQWRPKKFRFVPNQGAGLINYECVLFGRGGREDENAIVSFIRQLQQTGHQLNFPVAEAKFTAPRCEARNDAQIEDHLKGLGRRHESGGQKLELVMCFMPRKDTRLYSSIKYIAGNILLKLSVF